MSIDQPHVTVYCDGEGCNYTEDFDLCSLAQNSFDMRYITDAKLEKHGWRVDGDCHFCEFCAEDLERTD